MLLEDVGLNLEFSVEREVDADIKFLGNLPAYVRVGDIAFLDTAMTADSCAEVGRTGVRDGSEVDETAVTTDLVVTHETP